MHLYKIPGVTPKTPAAGATRDYWQALHDEGFVELIHDPKEGAWLGYADPILEERGGRTVAVAYALGTTEERQAEALRLQRDQAVISRFQAMAALDAAGLLPAIEAAIASAETPNIVKVAWSEAAEFRRNSPMLNELAAKLGISDEQLDELFVNASGIVA